MNNLNKISDLVESILKEDEKARDSDNYLYSRIISVIGFESGVDISSIPVGYFLNHMALYNVPKFESVRRARQKIQASNPKLKASAAVESGRKENESTFREWARQ